MADRDCLQVLLVNRQLYLPIATCGCYCRHLHGCAVTGVRSNPFHSWRRAGAASTTLPGSVNVTLSILHLCHECSYHILPFAAPVSGGNVTGLGWHELVTGIRLVM